MNTTPVLTAPEHDTVSAAPISAVPLHRIIRAELRKIVSTRWSRIALALATVASTLSAVIIVKGITAGVATSSWVEMFQLSSVWLGIVVAVLGIQTIAGEWSQRTHLVTFTLSPQRTRVWLAKLVAVAFYTLAATAVTMVICAAVYGLAGPITGTSLAWNVGPADLVREAGLNLISGLIAFAFGSVLLSPAVALVSYFAMPMVLGLLQAAFPSLREHAAWWDISTSMSQLHGAQLDNTLAAQLILVSVIWLVIPLTVGWWRVRTSDIA